MSYYYSYYIGYKKDGKIYPWGPYTANGDLEPVISRPRSFASDLHNYFRYVSKEEMSDELCKEFEYEDWNGNTRMEVKYILEDELPNDDFIKRGYFLIDDVKAYEKGLIDDFDDPISLEIYAAKIQHELTFGKNSPKKDCEGNEYIEPNASDYMYYVYPDYRTKEYESHILKRAIEALRDYTSDVEFVVLEKEG